MTTSSEGAAPVPIMTVRELRLALEEFPDSMQVLVDDAKGWWVYATRLEGPAHVTGRRFKDGVQQAFSEWDAEPTGYSLPTIMLGRVFDARDL